MELTPENFDRIFQPILKKEKGWKHIGVSTLLYCWNIPEAEADDSREQEYLFVVFYTRDNQTTVFRYGIDTLMHREVRRKYEFTTPDDEHIISDLFLHPEKVVDALNGLLLNWHIANDGIKS